MLIYIASGGTGGHIMPAKSVSEELLQKKIQIAVLGDQNCLKHFGTKNKFKIYSIPSSQIRKDFLGILLFAVKVSYGILKSLFLIIKHKPDYMICFGGYSTFPMGVAAILTNTKLVIHEQNAHLGKVNRLFAKYSYKIALSFVKTSGINKKYESKTIFTGNPVRKEIAKLNKLDFKLPDFNQYIVQVKDRMGYPVILHSDFQNFHEIKFEPLIITVIGGSGGAKIFSDVLPKAFFNLSEDIKERMIIFQQCRKDLMKKTFETYKSYNIAATVDYFFFNIEKLIEKSHLVIARSGSSTIFEMSAAKKPMILVPFAKSADDHQLKNAKYFTHNKAAIMIEEKNFTIRNISKILTDLLNNKEELYKLSENNAKLANIKAAHNICQIFIE